MKGRAIHKHYEEKADGEVYHIHNYRRPHGGLGISRRPHAARYLVVYEPKGSCEYRCGKILHAGGHDIGLHLAVKAREQRSFEENEQQHDDKTYKCARHQSLLKASFGAFSVACADALSHYDGAALGQGVEGHKDHGVEHVYLSYPCKSRRRHQSHHYGVGYAQKGGAGLFHQNRGKKALFPLSYVVKGGFGRYKNISHVVLTCKKAEKALLFYFFI